MPIPPMDIAASSSASSAIAGDTSGDRIFKFGAKYGGGDPRFELATAVVVGVAAVAALFFWRKR